MLLSNPALEVIAEPQDVLLNLSAAAVASCLVVTAFFPVCGNKMTRQMRRTKQLPENLLYKRVVPTVASILAETQEQEGKGS